MKGFLSCFGREQNCKAMLLHLLTLVIAWTELFFGCMISKHDVNEFPEYQLKKNAQIMLILLSTKRLLLLYQEQWLIKS